MKIEQVMTPYVRCVPVDATLVEVAVLMRDLDVGAILICHEDRLVGIVTDRDLVVRAMARGHDPCRCVVKDVMTEGVTFIFADQEVEDAAELMEQKQVRRLAVLNREKRLVGILSLGDVALHTSIELSGEALKVVSQ